jgi:hypothetical protein
MASVNLKRLRSLGYTTYVFFVEVKNKEISAKHVLGSVKLLFYQKKKAINIVECAPRNSMKAQISKVVKKKQELLVYLDCPELTDLKTYLSKNIKEVTIGPLVLPLNVDLGKVKELILSRLMVGVKKKGIIENFSYDS